jgi:hypothetical protein
VSKRLSEMNDDEAAGMLTRVRELVRRALPAGTFDGEAGFFMVILDVEADGEEIAQAHMISNVPRERVPELLHRLADDAEEELDAENAETDEDGGDEL